MKNVRLTSLVCGGILSLAGANLLAQTSSQSTSPGSSPSSSSSSSGQSATGNSSAYGSSTLGGAQSEPNVRLSSLLNSPVQSQAGKQIGYLRDVTVDPKSGRIEFGILSLSSAGATGSTAGQSVSGSTTSSAGAAMTAKLVPVPWQLFSQSWTGTQTGSTSSTTPGAMGTPLVLNIDESKLESAPSFEASNWNQLQAGNFDHQVYSHFGVSRWSGYGTSGSSMSGHGASGSQYQHNNYGTQGTTPGSTSGSTGTTPR